jgi:hypothetical protein
VRKSSGSRERADPLPLERPQEKTRKVLEGNWKGLQDPARRVPHIFHKAARCESRHYLPYERHQSGL